MQWNYAVLLTLALFLIIIKTDAQLAGHGIVRGYVEVFGRGIAEYIYKPFLSRVLIYIWNEPFAVACKLQQAAYLFGYLVEVAHSPLVRLFIFYPEC